MEQKFKNGDVVRLKSGGEKMTVHGYKTSNPGAVLNVIQRHSGFAPTFPENEIQKVICVWFEGKKMRSADFDEEILEIAI